MLPLTALSGPGVIYENFTSFDEQSAKKYGLPIVQVISKMILVGENQS